VLEGRKKEEIKVPWKLRHFCKWGTEENGLRTNRNFDTWPTHNRCQDCYLKEAERSKLKQQRIYMTKEQYEELVKTPADSALKHQVVGGLIDPTAPPTSIQGVPVHIVPTGVKIMIVGKDEETSLCVTGLGNTSKPVTPDEISRLINAATEQEKIRELDGKASKFGLAMSAFNEKAVGTVSVGCEVKQDESSWSYEEMHGEIAGTFVKDDETDP
jgi:hypothetical protein